VSSPVNRHAPLGYILTTGCGILLPACWVGASYNGARYHPMYRGDAAHALLTSSIVMNCLCLRLTTQRRMHGVIMVALSATAQVVCWQGSVVRSAVLCRCPAFGNAVDQVQHTVLLVNFGGMLPSAARAQPSTQPYPPFSSGISGHVGDVCVYRRCVSLRYPCCVCVCVRVRVCARARTNGVRGPKERAVG